MEGLEEFFHGLVAGSAILPRMVPDRTRACPPCALRVRDLTCPRCGGPTLDLRDRPPTAPPDGLVCDVVAAYVRYGIPALSLLGAGVLTYLHGLAAAILGMLLAFFAQVVLVPAVAGSVAMASWLRHAGSGRPARSIRLHRELAPPDTNAAVELVGVVRVRRALSSPLAHAPCAAWRLVGRSAGGEVDEAEAGELLLETDDGRAILVDARRAQVRLRTPPPPHPVVRPDAALIRLLEARALEPTRGPARLAERLVCEGDRIRVRGELGSARHEDGYRGHDEVARLEASVLLEA